MADLGQMLKELRNEKGRAAKKLDSLNQAISAFEKLVAENTARSEAPRRQLSAKARKSISRAQKRRWAKLREQLAAKT